MLFFSIALGLGGLLVVGVTSIVARPLKPVSPF